MQGTSGQVSRISRVFVFFVVSLRIQASELLRGNNPSEGRARGQRAEGRGRMTEGRGPVHKKQLLTYLRLTGKKLGLLINFGSELIRDGVSRVVNGLKE